MKLKKQITIAVDGHSSCGKSTFAKQIAQKLNYIYIDSGAMYRSIALYVIENNIAEEKKINTRQLNEKLTSIKIAFQLNNSNKPETYLNGRNVENEIRGIEVSELVSEVSKIKEVREYLVKLQQDMGKNKAIVMDGRDIGTVVFPDADIKLFMTANTDVRAQRRYDELTEKGMSVNFEDIKKNVVERDYIDMNRKESPLVQADDATVLDNSHMTVSEQMDWFEDLLKDKELI